MKLNCSSYTILKNIRRNIQRPLPQLQTHAVNGMEVAIVGGGWSLEQTLPELRELMFGGIKIIALNGAGNWLVEHNIHPSAVVVLDARPQNVCFVEKPIANCKYFLASQCDPAIFDVCEDREVYIWHVISSTSELERKRLDRHYAKRWVEIVAAGTVGLSAIMLARVLGFARQHLFGIDSCYDPKTAQHHAYAQAWNDDEGSAPFWCGGREFLCSAWQASQAQNMVEMIQAQGHLFKLAFHGDGLLAHMIKTCAALVDAAGNKVPSTLSKEA